MPLMPCRSAMRQMCISCFSCACVPCSSGYCKMHGHPNWPERCALLLAMCSGLLLQRHICSRARARQSARPAWHPAQAQRAPAALQLQARHGEESDKRCSLQRCAAACRLVCCRLTTMQGGWLRKLCCCMWIPSPPACLRHKSVAPFRAGTASPATLAMRPQRGCTAQKAGAKPMNQSSAAHACGWAAREGP